MPLFPSIATHCLLKQPQVTSLRPSQSTGKDVTEKDAYPLPTIDETLDSLPSAKWFSTLDLCYHTGGYCTN